MKEKLLDIKARVQSELNEIQDLKELDQLRVKYLGKKGEITAVMKEMGKLSAEERPVIGALANEVRTEIENSLQDKITLAWAILICEIPIFRLTVLFEKATSNLVFDSFTLLYRGASQLAKGTSQLDKGVSQLDKGTSLCK